MDNAQKVSLAQWKNIEVDIKKQIKNDYKGTPTLEHLEDLFAVAESVMRDNPENEVKSYALNISEYIKLWCRQKSRIKAESEDANDLHMRLMKWESRYVFDTFMLYLEKEREPQARFYQPRRKQLLKTGIIQCLQDIEDDKYDILTISMPPGSGKALYNLEPVLTPEGFVPICELKVGDKVISGTGKVCSVLGVYPQGKKKLYKLTFDDGSTSIASGDHLWTVQSRDDRNKRRYGENGRYRTITTEDMLKNIKIENGKRANYSIDYVPRIDFSSRELPIPPYVLGCFIADGTLNNGNMDISKAQEDRFIFDKIESLMPGYEFRWKTDITARLCSKERQQISELRLLLESLYLYNAHSYDKFIPKEYLYAAHEQRIELLRGLMDCDGNVDRNGGASYYTSSMQLAQDVQELAHSLGYFASLTVKRGKYKKDDIIHECRNSYIVRIYGSASQDNVFSLKRKADGFTPKRKVIKRFITRIAPIGIDDCTCIYVDDPSHLFVTRDYIITHNTTLAEYFIPWVIGRHPEVYNLFYTHSDGISQLFYQAVLTIMTTPEYCYQDIFPNIKLESKNAKLQKINFNRTKPFWSLQTGTIESNMAGRVRANGYVICDDLIGKMEQALNNTHLDKLWNVKYIGDLKQRKMTGCKEIHIATRWSVRDIVGRIIAMEEGNKRAKFLAVDCYDARGNSQFDYDYDLGLSTEFLKDQENYYDEISFNCLYRQQPIEREGLLYHDDELRRYQSLPDREPDAILGVCDTKEKGTDYMVMTIMYQYDDDFYMVDCVCDSDTQFSHQYAKLTKKIMRHNMQQVQFEGNVGGNRIAYEIEKRITEQGGRCNITTKPTESNKETKIIVNADWVKKHVIFRDAHNYTPKEDYGRFMSQLKSYSTVGKNKHDDVPDCLAMFALYVTGGIKRNKAMAIQNPFKRGSYY